MTYGESIGEHGKQLFEKAALAFFVEMQKADGFAVMNAGANADLAIEQAEVFVNAITESLACEVEDCDTQEEGGEA